MKFRTTVKQPNTYGIPATAGSALAHALGAAANFALAYGKLQRVEHLVIRALPDDHYVVENDRGEVMVEVSPVVKRKRVAGAFKPPPTLRQPGRRPRTGWYIWKGRDPDRLPDPRKTPDRPKGSLTRPYAFGFYDSKHQFVGELRARYTVPPYNGYEERDCFPPPPPEHIPKEAHYVVIFSFPFEKGSNRGTPIYYGLTEDFLTQST